MAIKITNFNDIYEQIIKKLTFRQRLIIGGSVLLAIIGIVIIILIANKPVYNVLFTDLETSDASKFVDKLKEKGVKYELSDNGKTISVPKELVYDLRLQLAGESIQLNSVVGYELFDKTNFGVSDFQQKVNYKRALEGELSRTIARLDAVDNAAVKISIPEKTLFKEDQKKVTASILLKLKSTKALTQENVKAITNLVASSIEGLEPANVTIIDSKGMLLSNVDPPNKVSSMTVTQHDLKKKIDSYLSDKAQSMLDQALGVGKSVVRVNAELNFNQVEKTSKTYDPNSVIRSQETNNQSEITYDTASESSKGTRVTNYEISETLEHIINEVGSVKKITVAAMVDGTYRDSEQSGQMIREYVARSTDEMARIQNVIKSAVGIDDARGDFLSVENIMFDTNLEEELGKKKKFEFDYMDITKQVMVVLAMIVSVLILRSLLRKLKPRKEEVVIIKEKPIEREILPPIEPEKIAVERPIFKAKEPKPPPVIEIPEPEATEDELKQIEIRRRVGEYITDKPQEAVNLVKLWLLEDEGR